MTNPIIKFCDHCRKEFEAERQSAKYCSNSCKTLACRVRRDLKNEYEFRRARQQEMHAQMNEESTELLESGNEAEICSLPNVVANDNDLVVHPSIEKTESKTFPIKLAEKKFPEKQVAKQEIDLQGFKYALIGAGIVNGIIWLSDMIEKNFNTKK